MNVISILTMLRFYGFVREESSGEIKISSNFKKQAENWLNLGNHNYKRLTRMLESLRLHGIATEAKALFNVLQKIYREHPEKIGATTFGFWKNSN